MKNPLSKAALAACLTPGCAAHDPEAASSPSTILMRRYALPNGGASWTHLVTEQWVTDLVGEVALQDCLTLLEAEEWQVCTMRPGPCSRVSVRVETPYRFSIDSAMCRDAQPIPDGWTWLVSGKGQDLLFVSIRRSASEELEATPGRYPLPRD